MVHNPHINPLELSSINAFQRNVSTTTEQYNFINTRAVLDQLADNGWHPVAANQAKVKDISREGFQVHNVKLEHREYSNALPGLAKPAMLLRHAHDGSSALKLLTAVDVFLCSNGLVKHSGDIDEVRVLHRGFTEEKLQHAIQGFVAGIPVLINEIDTFRNTLIDYKEAEILAQQAIELRFDPVTDSFGTPTNIYPVRPEQVLYKRRSGDSVSNLWGAMNVIQEQLIQRGGIRTRAASGRRVTTKAVKSIDANIRLNRGIWALTKAMADIKSGKEYAIQEH